VPTLAAGPASSPPLASCMFTRSAKGREPLRRDGAAQDNPPETPKRDPDPGYRRPTEGDRDLRCAASQHVAEAADRPVEAVRGPHTYGARLPPQPRVGLKRVFVHVLHFILRNVGDFLAAARLIDPVRVGHVRLVVEGHDWHTFDTKAGRPEV